MWPAASPEQAYTTPLAAVTAPEPSAAAELARFQITRPVAASSAAQPPKLTVVAVTGFCPSRLARGDTWSRGDSLAPVYLTRWALVGAIVLWCIGCIAMVFTDTVRWQLRGQVLVNITVMAAAAGILVVFMRSAAARGAAGRLARELDTTPLSAGRLARSGALGALGAPRPERPTAVPRRGRNGVGGLGRSRRATDRGTLDHHLRSLGRRRSRARSLLDDDPVVVEAGPPRPDDSQACAAC